jgi:hypothetical protein
MLKNQFVKYTDACVDNFLGGHEIFIHEYKKIIKGV